MEIEIACNLLDETSSTTRTQVQKKIEELMQELLVENMLRGVKLNGASCQIGQGYVTNLQPQDFLDAVSSTSSDDTASWGVGTSSLVFVIHIIHTRKKSNCF